MQSRQGTASLLKSWQHNWLSTGEILLSVREIVCFEISIICVTWSFNLTYSSAGVSVSQYDLQSSSQDF